MYKVSQLQPTKFLSIKSMRLKNAPAYSLRCYTRESSFLTSVAFATRNARECRRKSTKLRPEHRTRINRQEQYTQANVTLRHLLHPLMYIRRHRESKHPSPARIAAANKRKLNLSNDPREFADDPDVTPTMSLTFGLLFCAACYVEREFESTL